MQRRRIKSYRIWEKEGNLTSVQIDFLNRYVTGSWTMNPEGLVDVEGDFDCSSKKIVTIGSGSRTPTASRTITDWFTMWLGPHGLMT